jgi:hypothetical protein
MDFAGIGENPRSNTATLTQAPANTAFRLARPAYPRGSESGAPGELS